jgi:(+)-pinoresinol hydroxylase
VNRTNCLRLVIVAVLAAGPSTAWSAQPEDAAGRAVYERWCSHCHNPGVRHPGTNALTVKYQGQKSGDIRQWTDLTPELVRFWVRNGVSVMAPFRKTEITDAELDALARYLTRAGGAAGG